MKILLAGCGYWGQNWAKTLDRLGVLSSICEPDKVLQSQLKEKYPNTALYDNLTQALTCSDAEAVVIATPAQTHFESARAVLLSNRSVMVEKPMTLTSKESEVLLGLARERNLVLAVGHLLMYHPALLKLQSLVRSGDLGEILSVQCTRVNLGKIRNEENCWWSLAPHDISIISMLLEEPFEPISATGMNLLGRSGIADTVNASFKTDSGRFASIHVSWMAPFKKHETVVIGSRKIALFEDTNPPEKKLMLIDYNIEKDQDIVNSIQKGEFAYIPYEVEDEILAMEAKAFINAVQNGSSLQNDGSNGLQIVKTLEAVQNLIEKQKQCITV